MRFLRRQHDGGELESRLRADRPEPPDELVRRVSSEIRSEPRIRVGGVRLALIAGCTALLIAAVAAAGGVGSATSGLDGIVAAAQKAASPGPSQRTPAGKETICHATGSETNPYVEITVSEQGAANHKANHPDDIVPAPATGCGGRTPASDQYKVTICHRTSSAKNPYVEITVSEQGAAQHKSNHPEDIVPAPSGGCPS